MVPREVLAAAMVSNHHRKAPGAAAVAATSMSQVAVAVVAEAAEAPSGRTVSCPTSIASFNRPRPSCEAYCRADAEWGSVV